MPNKFEKVSSECEKGPSVCKSECEEKSTKKIKINRNRLTS